MTISPSDLSALPSTPNQRPSFLGIAASASPFASPMILNLSERSNGRLHFVHT
jgi:hypothetical protein